MKFPKDLTEFKFGYLKPLKTVGKNSRYRDIWLCACDCGATVEKIRDYLIGGDTKSCGSKKKHPDLVSCRTHGERYTPLYSVWLGIKDRCGKHKNYKNISIYSSWLKFEPFRDWAVESGYKEGLSIERVDVKGNYEPDNCTWIPLKDQAKNKSTSIFIYINNKRYCFWEAVQLFNGTITKGTALDRLKNGWSVSEAVFIRKGFRRVSLWSVGRKPGFNKLLKGDSYGKKERCSFCMRFIKVGGSCNIC